MTLSFYASPVVGLPCFHCPNNAQPMVCVSSMPRTNNLPDIELHVNDINTCSKLLSEAGADICEIPTNVIRFLQHCQSDAAPAPSPIDESKVTNIILGNNKIALKKAAFLFARSRLDDQQLPGVEFNEYSQSSPQLTNPEQFKQFLPLVLTTELSGDAECVGRELVHLLIHVAGWLELQGKVQSGQDKIDELERRERLIVNASERISIGTGRVVVDHCRQFTTLLRNSSASTGKPCGGLCFLLGGEATVKLMEQSSRDQPALGGRCSHLVLSAAVAFFDLLDGGECQSITDSIRLGILAGASDGLDGPAAYGAGAWCQASNQVPLLLISDQCVRREAIDALASGNSYRFLAKHSPNSIIPTNLTGTNVMDIIFAVLLIE